MEEERDRVRIGSNLSVERTKKWMYWDIVNTSFKRYTTGLYTSIQLAYTPVYNWLILFPFLIFYIYYTLFFSKSQKFYFNFYFQKNLIYVVLGARDNFITFPNPSLLPSEYYYFPLYIYTRNPAHIGTDPPRTRYATHSIYQFPSGFNSTI